ncbi:MAG: 4-(cytidine 5'-diphospho)-2-C-methyl-D-erythritol kinase [Candidatus Izemoplasmatales bacterium]|jgi:4-diphosphocytidyl-2-C-methyl-D-erythritol kinase
MIEEKAYAKVNLFLNVLDRRKDGYHNLEMINAKIALHDVIKIKKEQVLGTALIVSNDLFLSNQNNVVHDVASEMIRRYVPTEGVRIEIEKNIPFGAGLAGNSADAAAIIKGIDKLFGLNLTIEEMSEFGLRFGADIPYCLYDYPALVEGIGEIITELDIDLKPWKALLINPKIFVSTEKIFELGVKTKFANTDIMPIKEAIAKKNIDKISELLHNAFTEIVTDQYPKIKEFHDYLNKRLGEMGLVMSGTGSTFIKMIRQTEKRITDFIAENGENYFVGLFDFL